MRHVLLALLALGCGGGSASVTTATPVDIPPTLTVAPEHAIELQEVVLDAPGEGAPATLRFRPVVGQRQTVRMGMQIEVAIAIGDAPHQASRAPLISFDTETRVTEVAADGTFRVESRVVALNVDGDPNDPTVRTYQEQMAPLMRLEGWTVLDPRGRVLGLELTVPDDLPPQMAQTVEGVRDAMRQLLPPLPEEPVAAGARWHWEAPMSSNGLSFVQQTSYELRERDAEAFSLGVQLQQTAEPQPLPSPAPGVTTELLAMRSEGRGVTRLHHDGRAGGAELELRTAIRARTSQGENAVEMETLLRVVTITAPQ
ncbi:MAG: hypothetical protein R3B99_21325 [Polyangiales bacterium]|nr:hypothetical protein [Sandaracinus sp.]